MKRLFFVILMMVSSAVLGISKIERELIYDEGLSFHSYLDSLGNLTGGVGHLLVGEEAEEYPLGASISPSKARSWFESDLGKAEAIVAEIAPNAPLEVKEILTNMAFNLGRDKLMGFERMLSHIKAEDYNNACKEMQDSLWATQVPNRAGRLITRMCSFESSKHSDRSSESEQAKLICRYGIRFWGERGDCKHTSRYHF